MKQKQFKIMESTLVQYQQNNQRRNETSTDPTTTTVTTTTITAIGMLGRIKR